MRLIRISKNIQPRLQSNKKELRISDLESSIKSFTPGEWCIFQADNNEFWTGFVNPQAHENAPCAYLVAPADVKKPDELSPEKIIQERIAKAIKKRFFFKNYQTNSRIFYGSSDGLPGLIIDQFENCSLVQINTAGLDCFRELIQKEVEFLTKKKVYFLDDPKNRERECLPIHEVNEIPDIHVVENNLKFLIRRSVIQKTGFYFDHRENRYHMSNILSRLDLKINLGLDLFSYVGAWGLSALNSGVKEIYFVDQGEFETEVNSALSLNGFDGRGFYFRRDIFGFLDELIAKKETFELIMSDPPAFAKSYQEKVRALEGYSKLHRKILKLIRPGGLAVFSSCTHYVSHQEFQQNISDSASKEKRQLQLIHVGIQGFDHPITGLQDRACYIKNFIYRVE